MISAAAQPRLGPRNNRLKKSTLSPSRRRLVELLQRVNFGRVEALIVRNGEPLLDDPAPRIVFEVKLASENGPRPESEAADFTLRAELVDLFAHLDRLGNARIDVLTVRHGLPFVMHVEDAA